MPALNSKSIVDEFRDTVDQDVKEFEKVIAELIVDSIKATSRLKAEDSGDVESMPDSLIVGAPVMTVRAGDGTPEQQVRQAAKDLFAAYD
ncbi:MAG: hypothetical protein AAF362_05625 [Pseudomonadota bacterium]